MSIGSIKVRVNTSPTVKVRNIQYSPQQTLFISSAADVIFENTENNLSVLTYDEQLDKFVVQNVPRLNGGTF